MEEKSVEIPKIKGPLREQDSIRALLELLEQQGMEQEKGDVIRMADHIDSMEMQLGTVLKELGEMKKQLGVMQESKVKLFAVNTIQKAEHQVQTLRFQVGEWKRKFMERAEQRAGKESASAAYRGGKKLAVKTYEKIKEQRQRESVTATLDSETGSGGTSGQTRAKKGRTGAGRSIKIKPEAEKTVKEAGNRTVKTAPRMVKASPVSSQKVKTQALLQKKQAFQSMRAAREAKRAAMRSVQTAKQSAKTAKTTAKGLKAMAEAAAHAVKAAFAALMAGGGTVFVILILIVGIIGGTAFIGSSQSSEPLSAEVLAHTPAIQRYASEFGIPEYVPVIQAIMMQESGGRGTDPMQASECPYNTQYPNTPGAIQDADYSIKVGVQYYADCVREAGCESPQDMDKLKLSLQGYNYGNGYISWAIRNHGGYSEANALQFSQEQAAAHGWPRYGDPEYVPHVLRYYSGGG